MTPHAWLEIGGWIGSILVVASLTQARVLRFRWLNLAGSVIATAYNAIVGIWPFVAMNGAICLINIYWLIRLNRERHSPAVYETVPLAPDDEYLRYLLRINAADIKASTPAFNTAEVDQACLVNLVVRGDETVGVVIIKLTGANEAQVMLDWVNVKFRDFTPGQFVYNQSGMFAAHGLTRLRVKNPPTGEQRYYTRMGFRPTPQGWVLTLAEPS